MEHLTFFLSDNGGEFNNELSKEIGEQLNINIKTTAAESPRFNGIVEKQNGAIGNVMEKVMSDVGCSLEIAWCISAKNSLLNSYGYSPNQLVFGYNPNFPSVMQNKPPSLEGVIASKLIALHVNALHLARKRFIESEADQKLCKALRHKARYQLVTFFRVMIRYFIREVIQATGKDQELLLGVTINTFFRDTEVYIYM